MLLSWELIQHQCNIAQFPTTFFKKYDFQSLESDKMRKLKTGGEGHKSYFFKNISGSASLVNTRKDYDY